MHFFFGLELRGQTLDVVDLMTGSLHFAIGQFTLRFVAKYPFTARWRPNFIPATYQ